MQADGRVMCLYCLTPKRPNPDTVRSFPTSTPGRLYYVAECSYCGTGVHWYSDAKPPAPQTVDIFAELCKIERHQN